MKIDKEEWRPIEGFPNYEVSNFGRVRSLSRFVSSHNSKKLFERKGRILKILNIPKRYSQVSFKINGKQFTRTVHRLVAQAFIPNPENKEEVNHIDFNKHNNHVSNLEWVTYDENLSHAIANELRPVGENHYKAKKIINIITGEIIGSASEASKLYNISTSSLNRYLLSKEISKISFLRYVD